MRSAHFLPRAALTREGGEGEGYTPSKVAAYHHAPMLGGAVVKVALSRRYHAPPPVCGEDPGGGGGRRRRRGLMTGVRVHVLNGGPAAVGHLPFRMSVWFL